MSHILKFSSIFVIALIAISSQSATATKVHQITQAVIDVMATRQMRYHHFLWHQIRNLWNILDETTQQQIRDLGWEPPRPALVYGDSGESYPDDTNDSGEDFFNMHHQMMALVNQILQQQNPGDEFQGFQTIPAPGDTQYPALPSYSIPGAQYAGLNSVINYLKRDDFYWYQIQPYENLFNDPEVLRSLTLGQLGSLIEFTVHNWLHVRFSEQPIGLRPDSRTVMPTIDPQWDDPQYNTLLDTYAAHVNRRFWLIHGWVDDRIEAWKQANDVQEIQWIGTWEGGNMANMASIMNPNGNSRLLEMDHEGMHGNSSVETMEKLVEIILATGKCYRYDQKVNVKSLEEIRKMIQKIKCTKAKQRKTVHHITNHQHHH